MCVVGAREVDCGDGEQPYFRRGMFPSRAMRGSGGRLSCGSGWAESGASIHMSIAGRVLKRKVHTAANSGDLVSLKSRLLGAVHHTEI